MSRKISIFESFLAVLVIILLKVGVALGFGGYYSSPLSFLFDILIYLSVFLFLKKRSNLKVNTNEVSWLPYLGGLVLGISFYLFGEIIEFIEMVFNTDEYNLISYIRGQSMITPGLKTYIISILIVSPIFEELIFRGLIFQSFTNRFSVVKSVLLSSLFFWIGHLGSDDVSEVVTIFLLSAGACLLYFKTKNIYVCILMHFGFNFSNYLIRYFYYTIVN